MMSAPVLHLFEAVGIELEYMIVDAESLDVRPVADEVLARAAGQPAREVERGDVAWSNELVLHVLELKTNGPARDLDGWADRFVCGVREANLLLAEQNCRLLPSAMHPWMDPARDARLWPHEQNEIYSAYDRIFGTGGHGWVNLQSTHINLPFCGDDEFVRLHAAIRVVLPLLPALAASSPFVGGRRSGLVDNRLEYYRHNQKRIPSITGGVIPEPVGSQQEYHERVLATIYRDITPFDPDHLLRHEWLNSRGAIARFERGAIEIRLLDIQECPRADVALVAAVTKTVQALAEQRWRPIDALQRIPSETLRELLVEAIGQGTSARVDQPAVLAALGLAGKQSATMGEIWHYLATTLVDSERARRQRWDEVYACIQKEGNLAERLLAAVGTADSRPAIARAYGQLADALARDELFRPAAPAGC